MDYICYKCQKQLSHITDGKAGRKETCPHCSAELHVCLNCRYHDPASYNECRETQAERVLDKDRSNFCDYFSFRSDPKTSAKTEEAAKADQLKKLDDLFSS